MTHFLLNALGYKFRIPPIVNNVGQGAIPKGEKNILRIELTLVNSGYHIPNIIKTIDNTIPIINMFSPHF